MVGQFGPLNRRAVGPSSPLGQYAVGVMTSSLLGGSVLVLAGSAIAGQLSTHSRYVALALAAGFLVVLDALRLLSGRRRYSCGLPRQTPYRWGKAGKPGMYAWGPDTGLPFTTIRATSMPALAMMLLLLGFVPWWIGALYGVGLLSGIITGMRLRRLTHDPTGFRLAEKLLNERGSYLTRGPGVLMPGVATFLLALGPTVMG